MPGRGAALGDASGPKTADINRLFDDTVVDDPVTDEKPTVSAEATSADNLVHAGEASKNTGLAGNLLLHRSGKLLQYFPGGARPDDPRHYFFFPFFFAARISLSISFCV